MYLIYVVLKYDSYPIWYNQIGNIGLVDSETSHNSYFYIYILLFTCNYCLIIFFSMILHKMRQQRTIFCRAKLKMVERQDGIFETKVTGKFWKTYWDFGRHVPVRVWRKARRHAAGPCRTSPPRSVAVCRWSLGVRLLSAAVRLRGGDGAGRCGRQPGLDANRRDV